MKHEASCQRTYCKQNLIEMNKIGDYKCGEIFITNKRQYYYLCKFCNLIFDQIDLFEDHNLDQHLEIVEENFNYKNEISSIQEKFAEDLGEDDAEYLETDSEGSFTKELVIVPLKLKEELDYGDDQQSNLETNEDTDFKIFDNDEQYNYNSSGVSLKDVKLFTCQFCEKIFKNKEILYKHSAANHNMENGSATAVTNYFNKNMLKDNLRNHIQENSKEKITKECSTSNKINSHRKDEIHKNVVRHENDTTSLEIENSNFFCKNCPMYFTEKEELFKHVTIYNNRGVCPISKNMSAIIYQESFDRISNDNNEHELENKCSYCHKSFKLLGALKRHELQHETLDLSCKVCGKNFNKKKNLKLHEMIHTGERPHKCEHCPAAFIISKNLKAHHISKHTNDYNFPCTYDGCSQIFKSGELRKRHIKNIHLKERNYQCNDCGRDFLTSGHLSLHKKKMHMDYNDRAHQCKYCAQKFVQFADLRDHIHTHTGEKPYSCSYDDCSKSFTSKKFLSRHRKLHRSK